LEKLAVIAALVGLNGFFVACEVRVHQSARDQTRRMAEEGIAARFRENTFRRTLTPIFATQLA